MYVVSACIYGILCSGVSHAVFLQFINIVCPMYIITVYVTCRCCFYHIRDLRRIRLYMSLSVANTIATALVSSILDYCNSLLHNIAIKDFTKLQRVQNHLARVVTRSPRFSRSMPLLKSLHWLPVRYRIIFKICALSSKQPAYLQSVLTPARQPKQLWSEFTPRQR